MQSIKLQKQLQSLPIVNHDIFETRKFLKHSDLLGGLKRCLIVGASGCGKTNLLISLLLHPNGLRFTRLYLYCKTLDQSKYNLLRETLKEMLEESDKTPISPKKARKYSAIVFDDVVCDSQSIIRDYFSFGRHRHIDCFYCCQTYSSIPKQLVRDNANMIMAFKQDGTNLRHIYDDHVNTDMSFESFKQLCSLCWADPYGFVVIDKERDLNNGRYRKGIDVYIRIN